jgi:hypothetical protein
VRNIAADPCHALYYCTTWAKGANSGCAAHVQHGLVKLLYELNLCGSVAWQSRGSFRQRALDQYHGYILQNSKNNLGKRHCLDVLHRITMQPASYKNVARCADNGLAMERAHAQGLCEWWLAPHALQPR